MTRHFTVSELTQRKEKDKEMRIGKFFIYPSYMFFNVFWDSQILVQIRGKFEYKKFNLKKRIVTTHNI